jgi:proline utilization trans-activator
MTTRPILLHLFRCTKEVRSSGDGTLAPISEGARKIAKTCVQSARHSFRLLSEAWIQGSFAAYDYFNTQYLFSASIILAMSSLFEICKNGNDIDDFDTAAQILSQLSKAGNFGAKEFCLHMDAIKSSMEQFSLNKDERVYPTPTVAAMIESVQNTISPQSSAAITTGMALADSTLQEILTQPDYSFQMANVAGLDELQTSLWPDLWVGDWMNS